VAVTAAGIALGTTDSAGVPRAGTPGLGAGGGAAGVALFAAGVALDGLAVAAPGEVAVGLDIASVVLAGVNATGASRALARADASVASWVSRGVVALAAGGRFVDGFGWTRSVRCAPSRMAAATAGLGRRGAVTVDGALFGAGAFESGAARISGFTS
jgi:hypothetical protein